MLSSCIQLLKQFVSRPCHFSAGPETGNIRVDAFSEHVSETGRDLGGRVFPGPGGIVEQARTCAAADIRIFPVSGPASAAAGSFLARAA